jgi:hypothetical protein
MAHEKTETYVSTVTALLTHPGAFFGDRFETVSAAQASGVLTLSAIFFSTIGTLAGPDCASVRMGLILFVNALGMAAMGAGVAYVVLIAVIRRRVAFGRLWNLFSLSAGAVLLFAWIPAGFFFTEPWRWCLIGIGMVRGLGLSKAKAAVVVLTTFGVLMMVILTVLPMVLPH